MSAGFFVSRVGARRSFPILGFGFLAMAVASLLASRQLKVDILFAPMAVGSVGAVFLVQLQRLWLIDTVLTAHVDRVATRADRIEPSLAQARLTGGLKLLQTILPLEEAVVFHPTKTAVRSCLALAYARTQASRWRRNEIAFGGD